ncbi:VanZ family protein [Streptomyces diastatochromogenes]|uniref:VanZ family protein n=1 Tax=Streptomyces diastatochromogenes TaxID=42236 RepID=UPI001FC95A30|nr:VanZ family protein [Streptomyces diastatochromogenes]MCZ0989069.1 VanZ family protein [Streptomyces diastatochromogenes]
MFEAVFGDDMWFLAGLTVVALVVGVTAWAAARRREVDHAVWWLPLTFCLTGVLGVTLALRGGEAGRAECVINHEITEPLHTTQGLWNLAMFVPLGLFGVLALRRPLPVLVGVLALPCLIELAQALAPFVSGICDSADVEMNVGGGVLGVAAGLVLVRGRVAWRSWARPTLIVAGALAVAGPAVFQTAITAYHVDGSSVRDAHGDEREAAERVIRQAFGDRYPVGSVRISPGIDGYNGWMSIQIADGFPAELMWPGGRHLTVDFEDSPHPARSGFPVPGATAPHDTQDAYRIAHSYMTSHYPWAESASWHDTRPVGSKAESGWLTSWRFKERGVAMPRSLDVRINRSGRVSQLLVDFGPKQVELPARLISAQQAEEIVRKEQKKSGADLSRLRIHADTLRTERAKGWQGPWRVVWSVRVTDHRCTPHGSGAANGCEPYDTVLDAGTGEIYG